MNTSQCKRLGKILKIIGGQPGIKLAALTEELSTQGVIVSKKTVTKDIKLLKKDFCLIPDEERLKSGYTLTDILTVGTGEISIVIDALNAFSTNLKDESADHVVQRIERILKTTVFKSSVKTGLNQEQIYRFSADQQEYVRMLNEASEQHLAVRIGYRSPRGAEQILTGYPLWKLFHERGWYYINRRLDSEAFFSWRFDRITDCEILNSQHANANHNDDLKTAKHLIKNGWGMSFPSQVSELQGQNLILIKVRFNAAAAGFIKEGIDRHPRASINECTEEQGSVDFQIKLPKQCHSEFRNWVRSWGAKARFVSPQSFIERERTELRELLNKYES